MVHFTKMTPKEALLMKILIGDGSDNVPQLWRGIGLKKALNLIRDPEKLKAKLSESNEVAKQFLLNKKLVDMSQIPSELSSKIEEVVSKKFQDEKMFNSSAKSIESEVEFDLMSL